MKGPIFGPHKPSPFGERFFSYSPLLRLSLVFPSKLEYEYHLLLEFDRAVATYRVQPCEAVAFVDGKLRRSIPDFWVRYASGECCYIEVKYSADLRDPMSRAHRQIEIQRAWCSENGFSHRVVTDADIWEKPFLINSLRTLLYHYFPGYPDLAKSAAPLFPLVMQYVRSAPNITVAQVLARIPDGVHPEHFRFVIPELIRLHMLDAGLEAAPFTPSSRLNLVKPGHHESA